MLSKIIDAPNQHLGIAGVAGSVAASIFLAPERHRIKGPALIALSVGAFLFAKSRWV